MDAVVVFFLVKDFAMKMSEMMGFDSPKKVDAGPFSAISLGFILWLFAKKLQIYFVFLFPAIFLGDTTKQGMYECYIYHINVYLYIHCGFSPSLLNNHQDHFISIFQGISQPKP